MFVEAAGGTHRESSGDVINSTLPDPRVRSSLSFGSGDDAVSSHLCAPSERVRWESFSQPGFREATFLRRSDWREKVSCRRRSAC